MCHKVWVSEQNLSNQNLFSNIEIVLKHILKKLKSYLSLKAFAPVYWKLNLMNGSGFIMMCTLMTFKTKSVFTLIQS